MNRNYLRSIPREWRTISRAFTALGDEHRQRILLTFERGERLNVGQIAEVSTLSRPAISQHLRVLKEADLIVERRDGTRRWYRARPEGLDGLRDYLDSFWEANLGELKKQAER